MITNYYIGIGGTGARVAEALVHLCAAGYGPARLALFLIDPDEGNGNLSRTRELIARYQAARAGLREKARSDLPLFTTEIATPDPFVWSIFERGKTRLQDHINLTNLEQANRPHHDFANVLFTQAELREQLDQGFRGHPAIGAAVMAERAKADARREPWRTFWADIEKAQQNEVRVFMAGSIFGGTGAAGVPTFGAPDMLKYSELALIERPTPKHAGKSRIHLGGALVLPYFTFDAADPSSERLSVASADFPIATKAALQFYDEKELAFDQLYLIGDSLAQTVGASSPGSSNQENRPHYVEVASALAAMDFFFQKDGVAPSGRYFIAGRRDDSVDWKSLPLAQDADEVPRRQALFKRRLVTMAVFAYAFLEFGYPLLSTPPKQVGYAWHEQHFYPRLGFTRRDERQDPRQPEQRAVLMALEEYSRRFLQWAAALDEGAGGAVQLLDRGRALAGAGTVSHTDVPTAIGTLLREGSKALDFNRFKNLLDGAAPPSDQLSPAGKYAGLFYEAARRFTEENYDVVPEQP